MKNLIRRSNTRSAAGMPASAFALVLSLTLGFWPGLPAWGGPPPGTQQRSDFKTLEDLRQAFSHGLIPDPDSEEQLKAFGVYLKTGFGDPKTDLPSDLVQAIAKELKNHPRLIKETPQFRNYTLTTRDRVYPVTQELSAFLDPQVKSAKDSLGKLFQVEANERDWEKIFGFQAEKETWAGFLDERLPPASREKLKDKNLSAEEKAQLLYPVLKRERERLQSSGKSTRPITQAMIDLLHSVGFSDPAIAEDLKSQDGMKRLEAYGKALEARNEMSKSLELGKPFTDLLQEIGKSDQVSLPTGVTNPKRGISVKIKELTAEVEKKSTLSDTTTTRTIRHLSLFESPFRSCLGGSDCSSQTYPAKALDPNYHYFTLTNDQGESTGQITVVLGEGIIAGKPVKVAFVDKIQNVDHQILPTLMEGVRQSVLQEGYSLAIPDDVGNHNGISNAEATRVFVANGIQRDTRQAVTEFKPHGHRYDFENAYSRADDGLPSQVVSTLKLPEEAVIVRGQVDQPWQALGARLDLEGLGKESWRLKKSPDIQERVKYLHAQGFIRGLQLPVDPELDETLKLWLRDEKQDSKVRKAAVFFEWDVNRKPLHEVLASLPPKLQNELVDQIVQTPRLRLRFLHEFSKFPKHKRYGNADVFQVIAKFQKDLDLEVRAGAADALANLDGPKALTLLDVALSDAEDFVRSTAAEALANHQGPGALRLIERALSDQVSSVREVAAWALAKQRGPGALQLLERALNDRVDDVRFAAAGALAELDGPEALRLLREVALKDRSDYVKSAARDSLEAHRQRGTAGSIEDSLNCFEKN
jgi:hypothetical protein